MSERVLPFVEVTGRVIPPLEYNIGQLPYSADALCDGWMWHRVTVGRASLA